jgi:purine-binding chemotaxis protein CheW
MAIFSPLASRRKSRRIAEATQQLIVFRLRDENFALPIRAVQKVIPMDKIYGAPGSTGVSLTLYQDQELIVIDVGRRIFRGRPSEDSFKNNLPHQTEEALQDTPSVQHYLLIVQNSSGQVIGLPIEKPPSLLRVPESAFTPLSASYISEGNLRCVSVLIKQNNDEPPLFLLNPDQLVQAEPALPPAASYMQKAPENHF